MDSRFFENNISSQNHITTKKYHQNSFFVKKIQKKQKNIKLVVPRDVTRREWQQYLRFNAIV